MMLFFITAKMEVSRSSKKEDSFCSSSESKLVSWSTTLGGDYCLTHPLPESHALHTCLYMTQSPFLEDHISKPQSKANRRQKP